MNASSLPPQQLRMRISAPAVRRLHEVPLPPGYVLRGYRAGDEDAWIGLMAKAGFDPWPRKTFDEYMDAPERRAGSRCIEWAGNLVAGTFASRPSLDSPEGSLDYVIGDPAHSGRGLGRAVCTAVLRHLVQRGCETVFLSTDDWRLPALHVYLTLGFRPLISRVDMAERWQEIYRKLGFEPELSG